MAAAAVDAAAAAVGAAATATKILYLHSERSVKNKAMRNAWPLFFLSTLFFCPLLFTQPKDLNQIPNKDLSKNFVVLGDSLTEGYGVAKDSAFPALLEKKLGSPWKVIAAGISGSTSASALSRMKWQLKAKPDVVLLALGSNDALRGLKPEETEKNLAEAIEFAQKEKVSVLLAGLMAPPNYGKEYSEKFKSVFVNLEKKYKIKRMPFLLEGVAGESKMNLPDGIHPNEKGHAHIAEQLSVFLKGIL